MLKRITLVQERLAKGDALPRRTPDN